VLGNRLEDLAAHASIVNAGNVEALR
jgi:hypothetical protein